MNQNRAGSRRQTRKPRRDRPPALRSLTVGLVVSALLAGVGFELLRVYNGIPGVPYETAYASLPTVGNLLSHDAVRISGRRVGQVISEDIGSDGRPRVKLQLNPDVKLYRGAQVAVRASGLLGARYVELKPGLTTGPQLADGTTIEGGANSYTYGLPEAVAVFDEQARGGLRKTVRELGTGVLGNGVALNPTLKELGYAPRKFEAIAKSILKRDPATARLIPSLEAALRPLDETRATARPLMQATRDAVTPFVTERAATRATISAAPGALAGTRDGLGRGVKLLASVREVSTVAERTLPRAPAGLTQLSALLTEAKAPLRRAEPTVRTLLPKAASSIQGALRASEPVVPRLKAGIDLIRSFMKEVGDYRCDVENAGAVLRSMTGFGQSGSGPLGPAMAFRLQVVAPGPGELLGIKDNTSIFKRSADEAPCRYLSTPYPQLASFPSAATKAAP